MLHFAQRLVSKLVCLNENNKLKDGKKKNSIGLRKTLVILYTVDAIIL